MGRGTKTVKSQRFAFACDPQRTPADQVVDIPAAEEEALYGTLRIAQSILKLVRLIHLDANVRASEKSGGIEGRAPAGRPSLCVVLKSTEIDHISF
jgi:hypothetical protein